MLLRNFNRRVSLISLLMATVYGLHVSVIIMVSSIFIGAILTMACLWSRQKDPAGKWDDPVCVIPSKGMIDTSPLWDEDGRVYLVNGWANSRNRFASVITVRELNADGTKAISDPVIVFDGNGTENRTCEGPKFYKRNGWYWVMFPAGGVPTGFQGGYAL